MNKVSICGIPHTVVEREDYYGDDACLGQINYAKTEIFVNSKVKTPELKNNIIIHEMVHGIFTHIGRNDLCDDEALVQTMANAISDGFYIREIP